MKRIAWVDSSGMSSLVHATHDGVTTACGGHDEYISGRQLAKAPSKKRGRSNYCPHCFKDGGKSSEWDSRCIDVDWEGRPATAPAATRRLFLKAA
jgi:hypothetical protein